MSSEVKELFNTVVKGGYCVGCGACTAVPDSPIGIKMDDNGCYQAVLNAPAVNNVPVLAVCPFSDHSLNEDAIGKELFEATAKYDSHLGYYISTYAGYVKEGDFRAIGSSGGMGKWILYHLLRENAVDTIIQVKAGTDKDALYQYRVLSSKEEILQGSKSVYYPIEMSEILQYITTNTGRYAIVGIPCFIKAIRLLINELPVYKERILYCVGLICGHLKSTGYADMLAWQRGISPGDLDFIDFRRKIPGQKANEKGLELISKKPGKEVSATGIVQDFFGTDYNLGFFKYKACDYCDDVVAETADITIGDAWLPQYLDDGGGTNVIIVRNVEIQKLIEKAMAEDKLHFEILPAEAAIRSQAAGFRHRREGLAYRLYKADKKHTWHPPKRVAPGFRHLTKERVIIYSMRVKLAEASHYWFKKAKAVNNYNLFEDKMLQVIAHYSKDRSLLAFYKRGLSFSKRKMRYIINKLGLLPLAKQAKDILLKK